MKTASFMKNEVLLRYVFTFLLLKRLKSFVCFSFPSFWGPLKSWRQLSSGKKEVNNETGSTTVESHNPAPGTTHFCAQLVCLHVQYRTVEKKSETALELLKKCTQACAMHEGSRNHANLCESHLKQNEYFLSFYFWNSCCFIPSSSEFGVGFVCISAN